MHSTVAIQASYLNSPLIGLHQKDLAGEKTMGKKRSSELRPRISRVRSRMSTRELLSQFPALERLLMSRKMKKSEFAFLNLNRTRRIPVRTPRVLLGAISRIDAITTWGRTPPNRFLKPIIFYADPYSFLWSQYMRESSKSDLTSHMSIQDTYGREGTGHNGNTSRGCLQE